MASSKNKIKRLRLGLLLGFIFLFLFILFPGWIVEWAWLGNLDYSPTFWKIKGTQLFLFIGAFLLALLYLLPNFKVLIKNTPPLYINFSNTPFEQFGQRYIQPKQFKVFSRLIAGIFSLFFAGSYFFNWDSWFRFMHPQKFGETDPIFNWDIGFYIFQLPFLQTLQSSLISLVFFTTALLVLLYAAKGSIVLNKSIFRTEQSSHVIRHICINLGIWSLLLAFGYFLDQFKLLFDPTGVVFGADYTDIKIQLPVIRLLTLLTFLLALFAFYQASKKRFGKLFKAAGVVIIIGIIGLFFIPWGVQSMSVKPNELNMEEPYLVNNIAMTRKAYGLDNFHETSYDASDTISYSDVQKNMQTIDNIRLWDSRPILETYRQLQEIRLYYSFPSISVNRYHTNRGYEQMMVAARELNTSKLPAKAQTWVNRHLQYTHGYGITMSPVAATNADGNPQLLIKDLPPVSSINLQVEQPAIYYGQNTTEFKLVNTEIKELDYPKGKENVYTHYDGRGGVPIDNFLKKLLFSIYFGDYNLLLTKYLKKGSRIQFWREIQPRIKKAAPFLELNEDPYLVLGNGKLYWIQDAYLTSTHYPYSQPYSGRKNYIRNSVKVVVDAYHGDVNFYITDENDPLLKTYQSIFPKMFKPLDEIPGDLENHIRYPDYLFKAQMKIYNTYHMTSPQTFYNNEDLWERANSKYAGQTIKMKSYYIVSKLPGENQLQYLLISPLTPHRRDNMVAWMAAESDAPNYGKVHVYELPKSRLFLGPAQIEAKIDQNTEISRQLSLWDQRGSSVIRGNLMIIPVENSFIYVEPVFLIAQGVNIPQLKRVIATVGDKVVMEPTLHEAVNALYDRQLDLPITDIIQPLVSLDDSVPSSSSPQLNAAKSYWKELEEALKNQQWEEFGRQLQKMDSILKEQ